MTAALEGCEWSAAHFSLNLPSGKTGTHFTGGCRRCPEVSRKLSFPDYVTVAQDGGKVVSLTYRPPLPS